MRLHRNLKQDIIGTLESPDGGQLSFFAAYLICCLA